MTRELRADALDFTRLVRPGDTVIWTQTASEPTVLVERLLDQRHAIGPFTIFLGASLTGLVRPEHADVIGFVGLGAVGANRAMCKAGAMRIVSSHLSDLPRLLADGRIRVDVALLQLSPENADGAFSLGPVNGYVQSALRGARTVVAEVNDQAPWTFSRHPVDPADIDLIVRTSRPLAEAAPISYGETDRRIAERIVGFIPDGAILQIGIGTIPNAVVAALKDHRDLGLHAGVVGDEVVGLIEAGVVTNATKPFDTGLSVTGGLMGSRRLYRFAHENRSLLIEPVTYTHDVSRIGRFERFVAVNGAIEVDLTGQIGAEVAGDLYVGTIGGQTDFVRGAFASPGGRSIIGLPARTGTGRPRIVARIASGIVTTARADADLIVTEYGAADLRGQTIAERVRRMIAIAHPDDRERLEREARDGIVGL